jgi:tetratricopeptide (TPR) repeat protein
LTGPARARYLLQRCQALRPGNFGSLSEEYHLVSVLGDADAIYLLSRQLLASKARTGQQVRLRSLVEQSLNFAQFRAAAGPGALTNPAAEVDEQVRELFESRRFMRISARFATEMSAAEAGSSESQSHDLVAKACLICGDPASARNIWGQMPDAENDSYTQVCLGMACLAEQDHHGALRHFENAVSCNPSNADAHCALAVCHLELGNASAAVNACDRALDNPEIAEGLRQFCERMREFAARNRTPE